MRESTMMTWTEYLQESGRTQNRELAPVSQLTNAAMGMMGEVGEIADVYKKRWYHPGKKGLPVTVEMGDLYWYLALACRNLDTPGTLTEDLAKIAPFDVLAQSPNPSRRVMAITAEMGYTAASFTMGISHATRFDNVKRLAGCLAALCGIEAVSVSQVLQENVTKLRARWPQGFGVQR